MEFYLNSSRSSGLLDTILALSSHGSGVDFRTEVVGFLLHSTMAMGWVFCGKRPLVMMV